jgi:hypothetical protein
VPRLAPRRTGRSRKNAKGSATIIHRIVRYAPECPVRTGLSRVPVVLPANSRPHDQRVTRGSANGQKVAPDCQVCHGGQWLNGRRHRKRKEITHCSLSGGAPDCPVRPRTEGNQSLPNRTLTASSCLGAIKETPKHMEHNTKQSFNIQQRRDIEFAPLL